MLKTFRILFYMECLLLLRRSQEWLYPLCFFIIVISLFPLALTPDTLFLQTFMPGCFWMAALFASVLSIENIFMADLEDAHLDQQLLSSLPLSSMVLVKLVAQWLVSALPLILLTPILGLLFHFSATSIRILCISLFIGTPILTFIGSFAVALTIGLRQQGMLLSLLILPLAIPVLIFGVTIESQARAGFSVKAPLLFLSGIAVFAITTLPFAIASTLRIGRDE